MFAGAGGGDGANGRGAQRDSSLYTAAAGTTAFWRPRRPQATSGHLSRSRRVHGRRAGEFWSVCKRARGLSPLRYVTVAHIRTRDCDLPPTRKANQETSNVMNSSGAGQGPVRSKLSTIALLLGPRGRARACAACQTLRRRRCIFPTQRIGCAACAREIGDGCLLSPLDAAMPRSRT
jgi:hypothetical protein